MISAVQWIPSKELLDRSPRAGGLSYEDLTNGSWHPELLPTLIVREAYGTRARDTDWMDGFYPYHEMNAYVGVLGIGLAVLGAAGYRDRWVGFWVLLGAIGGVLMLGKFTAVFDLMPMVPVVGKSRIPVRYHLWVTLAVSALASVGADRLSPAGEGSLAGGGPDDPDPGRRLASDRRLCLLARVHRDPALEYRLSRGPIRLARPGTGDRDLQNGGGPRRRRPRRPNGRSCRIDRGGGPPWQRSCRF